MMRLTDFEEFKRQVAGLINDAMDLERERCACLAEDHAELARSISDMHAMNCANKIARDIRSGKMPGA